MLQIYRLKANPSGKDRSRFGRASTSQLGAEWVDIKNIGRSAVSLEGVVLEHKAFSGVFHFQWAKVESFRGTLDAGKVVRVHAGLGPLSALDRSDRDGADFHIFHGGNYVWNNDRGDAARLRRGTFLVDLAEYDGPPPEGIILERQGSKLVSRGRRFAG